MIEILISVALIVIFFLPTIENLLKYYSNEDFEKMRESRKRFYTELYGKLAKR